MFWSPVLTPIVEHAQPLIYACSTSRFEHAQPPARVDYIDALPVAKGRGSATMTEDESQAAAEDLAKRLRLLMDVAVAESGTEPTYSQIAGYLHERGTNLSRSRWTYMVNGHRYVQDPAVFEGLAAFFDVDAAFLLGEDGAANLVALCNLISRPACREGQVLRSLHSATSAESTPRHH